MIQSFSNLTFPKPHLASAMIVLLAFAGGCGPTDGVTTYTIPNDLPESMVQRDRMLGGIVPIGESVWYYKLVSDTSDVETIQQEFKTWVVELEYADGAPNLDTPESWRRVKPGMMQEAKFLVPANDAMIEMSVARLGKSGEWADDVLRNVNRWRGQMGLEPEQTQWAGAEELEIKSDAKSDTPIWVVLDGVFGKGGGMRPPMMGGGQMASSPPPAALPPEPREPLELDFDVPEGWTEGKKTSMRLAAFNVPGDDGNAEVTVIEAGGNIVQNVAMWLTQVKPDSDPREAVQQMLEEAEDIEVLGKVGTRFRLFGTEETNKAIDVAVIPLEGQGSLFVKMTGDLKSVKSGSDAFMKFLSSIKNKKN